MTVVAFNMLTGRPVVTGYADHLDPATTPPEVLVGLRLWEHAAITGLCPSCGQRQEVVVPTPVEHRPPCPALDSRLPDYRRRVNEREARGRQVPPPRPVTPGEDDPPAQAPRPSRDW